MPHTEKEKLPVHHTHNFRHAGGSGRRARGCYVKEESGGVQLGQRKTSAESAKE